MNITVCPIRKPLLYPSELRGHGRAPLVHRFDLREVALALVEAPLKRLATELAPVSVGLAMVAHRVVSSSDLIQSPPYRR